MTAKALPYVLAVLVTFLSTLVLTPVVRELCRSLGMVDKPGARRINREPVPRGGGLAIVVGVLVPYLALHLATGRPWIQGVADAVAYRTAVLSVAIAALGFLDDRFSLSPKLKLLGQVVIAALVWAWAGLGFSTLWPWLPAYLDCALTVFWIVGAVNAFNLIDGLDGLAAGISLIAVIGIGGTLFFTKNPQANLFYWAVAGGLIAFLRYNWNPASVFLGDCGSMFLGFLIATLPLASQTPDSFLVSVGVPLLAMGVPIFDTTLAIVRRSLRHLFNLSSGRSDGNGEVMTADTDHLHHRLLRAMGLNQRKTALILYATAALGVLVGVVAVALDSRAGGLWLLAFAVAAAIVIKDASIEIYEVGKVADALAHPTRFGLSSRRSRFTASTYLVADLLVLAAVYFVCARLMGVRPSLRSLRLYLPVRLTTVFAALVFFRAYRTIWPRAMLSNYVRLFLACFFGSVAGSIVIYYWPTATSEDILAWTALYTLGTFFGTSLVRTVRQLGRDVFYALDCRRMLARKDVSRVLVYGSGLRYRAFRRELVRNTSANSRIIVGIIDDDPFLHGHYLGGIRVLGAMRDATKFINDMNVDAVVIACDLAPERLAEAKAILAPTGVKLTRFSLSETEYTLKEY